MKILEFLGLRPTFHRFAARLLQAMPAESGEWKFDAERGSLMQPGGTEVSLHSLFMEYSSTGVFGRAAMIRKYADLAFSHSREIPELWVGAAKNIYPVVRSEFVETTLEIRSRASGATMDPIVFPLAGDLRIRLVYDFGSYVSYVKGEHLDTWAQPRAEVLERAVANLARLSKPSWLDSGRGYFSLASDDSYGESMLQLDSVVAGLPFAAHAVFLPCNRGILLAADQRSERGIAAMLAEASRCLREEPWPMSVTLCGRGPEGWQEFEPPASVATLAHTLFVQHRAENYAVQREELDALHEGSGRDVFVADCALLGNDDHWESYCVWSEGVKSLLPMTDTVALMPEGEDAEFVRVPWQRAIEICGPRMQQTAESPPRYLVDSFPGADEWSALSAHAITN